MLAVACQFGHGLGGSKIKSIHPHHGFVFKWVLFLVCLLDIPKNQENNYTHNPLTTRVFFHSHAATTALPTFGTSFGQNFPEPTAIAADGRNPRFVRAVEVDSSFFEHVENAYCNSTWPAFRSAAAKQRAP